MRLVRFFVPLDKLEGLLLIAALVLSVALLSALLLLALRLTTGAEPVWLVLLLTGSLVIGVPAALVGLTWAWVELGRR